MFKQNPNFNQYYGLIHQTDKKYKKLKRTEFSGQKLQSSKKSISQDSLSNSQIDTCKRNLNFQNNMNKRKYETGKVQVSNKFIQNSQKSSNILDQFKIQKQQNYNTFKDKKYHNLKHVSKKFVGVESDDQETNKFQNVKYQNQYELNEYFGDSVKMNLKNSNHNSHNMNKSKSKSHKSRQSKSPLRRILKSKSRQFLPSPVQKIYNIVKKQQKLKQQKKEIQKTLKQANYYRTMNQLNDTYSNVQSQQIRLKKVVSQKKLFLLQSYHHQKNPLSHLTQRYKPESHLYTNKSSSKQKLHLHKSPALKKVKINQEIVAVQINHMKSIQKPKISTSKIKKYFHQKQQKQKQIKKMKYLLQDVDNTNHIEQQNNLRKIQSEKGLSYSNVSEDEEEFYDRNNGSGSRNGKAARDLKYLTQKKNYYQQNDWESQSPNSRSQSFQQYSDYGIQPFTPQKPQHSKKFVKTPSKVLNLNQIQIRKQDQESPQGQILDNIKSFSSSKFNQFPKQEEISAQIHSNASIEQKMQNQYVKNSVIGSSYSKDSQNCVIHVISPNNQKDSYKKSNSNLNSVKSQKKLKQSILDKLKKDIEDEKLKKSKVSKKSSNKNSFLRNSSISKSSSNKQKVLSNRKSPINQKDQKQNKLKESDYISGEDNIKISQRGKQNKSQVDNQLSNLIQSSEYKKRSINQNNKFSVNQIPNISKRNSQNQMANSPANSNSMISSQKVSSNSENISDSMINSHKVSQTSQKINKSLSKNSDFQEIKNQQSKNDNITMSKQLRSPPLVQNSTKKSLKVIKIIRDKNVKNPVNQPVNIPKMEQSNMESMTDSNPNYSQSLTSLRTSPMKSSASFSQNIKGKNVVDNSNNETRKRNVIRQEEKQQISQCQSQPYQQSVDMTSSQQIGTVSSSQSQQSKSKRQLRGQSSQQNSNYVSNYKNKSSSNRNLTSSNRNLTSSEPDIHTHQNRASSATSSQLTNSLSLNSNTVSNTSNRLSSNGNNRLSNTFHRNNSNLFKKKKNFAEYTLNDVARYIEEHEFRIQAFYQYIQNSKSVYEQDYQLQKVQFLSFLMLKKNLFEINRTIKALQGKGENVFSLTDIEIIDDVLEEYLDRQQIKQQLNILVKQEKQTNKEFQQMYKSFQKKYSGEKGFNLNLQKDDFSSQIVRKLGQELNNLYERWQKNKSDGDKITASRVAQKYEKRMIEIIELIFLTSQLKGNKVKVCELASEADQQFRSYYEKWFQVIIQTIQYFDQKSNLKFS